MVHVVGAVIGTPALCALPKDYHSTVGYDNYCDASICGLDLAPRSLGALIDWLRGYLDRALAIILR
jgi:hypothetical protein